MMGCGQENEKEGVRVGVKRGSTDHASARRDGAVEAFDLVEHLPALACSRRRAVVPFGWVFFLISPACLHVRPMGRTCRRAGEIDLTPIGAELNGSHAYP